MERHYSAGYVLIFRSKLFRHPAFWSPILGACIVALFAGQDVVSRSVYLSAFVSFMSAVVPSIKEWGIGSPIREPIMLYLSMLWVFVPLQVWLALSSDEVTREVIDDWVRKKGKKYYGPLLWIMISIPCTYYIITVGFDQGDECVRFCIGRSRLNLALMGFLLPISTAIIWAIALCPLRYFRRIYT